MQLDEVHAYLLLGTNLGDREDNLAMAIAKIGVLAGKVVGVSSVYETAPWGKTDQPGFLNQAIAINTKLKPQQLLTEILAIEADMGRVRKIKWGERLIDIDIIFYGAEIIEDENLVVPHPLMHERKFVLVPLVEIAEDFIHPKLGLKNSSILSNLSDNLLVKKLN